MPHMLIEEIGESLNALALFRLEWGATSCQRPSSDALLRSMTQSIAVPAKPRTAYQLLLCILLQPTPPQSPATISPSPFSVICAPTASPHAPAQGSLPSILSAPRCGDLDPATCDPVQPLAWQRGSPSRTALP